MADFIKPVTINIFKFRRYIQLFDPTKCSIEALSHNEAKWTKTIDDLYNEILNAAAEVVTNNGVDQADAMVVESMLDAIEDEYREYFVKFRAKLYHDFKGAKVIVKKGLQCEPHSRDSKATVANIAHTADEHVGIESSQRGQQMFGYNGQVDVASKERDPAAMEDYNLTLGVQEEVVNNVALIMERGNAVTRYPRVYNAAAKRHTNGYRYLYECEEVRGQQDQQDEVDNVYNSATIGSREKVNFHNKFQYHGG